MNSLLKDHFRDNRNRSISKTKKKIIIKFAGDVESKLTIDPFYFRKYR